MLLESWQLCLKNFRSYYIRLDFDRSFLDSENFLRRLCRQSAKIMQLVLSDAF